MPDDEDAASMPEMLEVKQQALDVLTIFSDNCMVRFVHSDGKVDEKKGRWLSRPVPLAAVVLRGSLLAATVGPTVY